MNFRIFKLGFIFYIALIIFIFEFVGVLFGWIEYNEYSFTIMSLSFLVVLNCIVISFAGLFVIYIDEKRQKKK